MCAVKKYGWENVQKDVLLQGMCEDAMDIEEVRLIEVHDTVAPKGYNVQKGGKRHSGYVRRDGPLVKGPRSAKTKANISQGHAERRAKIVEKVENSDEACKLEGFLERQRVVSARARAETGGASRDEWKGIAKERRAETWRLKREATWEEMGLSEEERVKRRRKTASRAAVRAKFESNHPGVRTTESKEYMLANRKRYNDARPKLTGNLRANS